LSTVNVVTHMVRSHVPSLIVYFNACRRTNSATIGAGRTLCTSTEHAWPGSVTMAAALASAAIVADIATAIVASAFSIAIVVAVNGAVAAKDAAAITAATGTVVLTAAAAKDAAAITAATGAAVLTAAAAQLWRHAPAAPALCRQALLPRRQGKVRTRRR